MLLNEKKCPFNKPSPFSSQGAHQHDSSGTATNKPASRPLSWSNHTVLTERRCCGPRNNDCIVLLPCPIREGQDERGGGSSNRLLATFSCIDCSNLRLCYLQLCYSFSVWSPHPSTLSGVLQAILSDTEKRLSLYYLINLIIPAHGRICVMNKYLFLL
jgi:hypothetical protein